MRTLLIVYFVGTLFAQPSSPPTSPGRGEQPKGTKSEQAVPHNNPPKSTETPFAATAPEQPPPKTDTGKGKGEPQGPWRKYLCKAFSADYLSNWVLAFFALLAAGIGLKTLNAIEVQARAARIGLRAARIAASASTVSAKAARESADTAIEAAKSAEEALHLTERADILADRVELNSPGLPPDTMGPQTTVTIHFKNFGRTRANNVHYRFWLGVPGVEPAQEPTRVSTLLGPGDTQPMPFPAIGDCVNKETFERIMDGEVPLQFGGEVTYTDVFGKPQTTTCAGTFRPRPLGFDVDRNEAT